ncbi:MAG TPA: radical SAM protein [Bryobacterales bacterium]|nr:radical SAM protein [Bryobacterales bacterium]
MLFPDFPPPQPLVGIARLAAQSPLLEAKSRVEYFELEARSILNKCSSSRMPFPFTINPYRGCEFGCRYCYARYTHEFMGMDDGRLFEEKIYAKTRAAGLLRQELRRHPEGEIAIGTSTDPYQPAERRFGVTRGLLEVFAGERGRVLSITTKSDLVARDAELLARVARANVVHVNMTITTLDAALARQLEPRAPRPDLRLAAVEALASAGLSVGVFLNPILPGLTDAIANLDAVAGAAKRSGAQYLGGGILFLMPSAQKQFFPFLEAEFPALAPRYRARFAHNPYLRGEYARRIRERVARLRERHGLASAPREYTPEFASAGQQLALFECG